MKSTGAPGLSIIQR